MVRKPPFSDCKTPFSDVKTAVFWLGKRGFITLFKSFASGCCWWSRLRGTPRTTIYLNWRKLNYLDINKKLQNICHCHCLLTTYWLSAIYFFVMVTDDLKTGLRPHKKSVFWCRGKGKQLIWTTQYAIVETLTFGCRCRWQQKSSVTHLSPW